MTQPDHLDAFFRCAKFSATLTRARCASMHKSTRVKHYRGRDAVGAIELTRCKGCGVGEAHARARMHPGAPTVQQPLVQLDATRKRRTCLRCGASVRAGRGRSWFCSIGCASDHGAAQAWGEEHPADRLFG